MAVYSLLIVTSLFVYAASLDCPSKIKNCSCDGVSSMMSVTCSQKGYFVLPEDMTFDLSVEHVSLDQNKLTAINDNHFKNLGSMSYLTLRENKITTISEDAFHNNPKLSTLDLSHNELTYLPPKLFKSLDFLTYLYLGNNKLKRIESEHLSHIMTLQDVRMNNNELTEVGENAFINSAGITHLYLEFNRLEIPEKNWLIHFKHTGDYEVYLDENPWSCDCRMKEFYLWTTSSPWFLSHEMKGVSVPQCSTPPNLKGTNLARIVSESNLSCVHVTMKSQTRHIKTVEGQKVAVACDANGFPLPDVTIANSARKVVASSPDGHAVKVFDEVAIADSGVYYCNASGYNEKATSTFEVIRIELTVYRSPTNVVSVVLISLFVVGVGLGFLVWLYKKKYRSKSSYGRIPNNSAYYDSNSVTASAKYSAESIRSPLAGRPAPTSVTNHYQSEADLPDDDEDDVIAEFNKDTEFLV